MFECVCVCGGGGLFSVCHERETTLKNIDGGHGKLGAQKVLMFPGSVLIYYWVETCFIETNNNKK